jgi:hypothetical protein
MNYYAHGGLANAAQHLAQKGRNGDTQLIHVSPKELHGLQALAKANGTTLTINPDTGLPEAFNFKKLIPMVAGAALTATGVGAPMAALMVGGAYAAGTGSIQKGLMAGIGAYGGAGLGAGLAEAGASSALEATASKAAEAGTTALDPGLASYGTNMTPQALSQGVSNGTIAPTAADAYGQAYTNTFNAAPAASTASNMGQGISQLGSQQGLSAAYAGMPTGTLPALGATALDAGQKERSSVPGYQEDEYDRRLKGYKLSPDYQAYSAPQPSPYYRPTYAAIGGIMNSDAPHSFDDESGSDNVGMAGGGIAGLGGYSDGGRMLKGPGDGMSDSIPGVIGGKQPARLADGEFVVPADVVSHLGNGSTDAGAKKLYSMMDKVRQARTGKKKQAPQVNVDKYLPMGKASGGIAGYADGGVIGYADGGDINPEIARIYQEQFGRAPDAGGAAFWSNAIANGMSVADANKAIAQSLEGQQMDVQAATSAYRQAIDRNPEVAGMQYWLSAAQDQGLTNQQLIDSITAAAAKEQAARNIAPGTKFTNLQSNSLDANPYAGYYSDKSIYDIAPNAENVSTIGGKKVQFTTPVTQQAVVSNFGNGTYSATSGKDILNMPHVQAAINVARDNGTLSAADYSGIVSNLGGAKTVAEIRAALAKPQAQVVIDAIQGQQIGEAKTLADAQAEAVQRQAILSKQDPGYYQSNRVLSDAYQKTGVSTPFNYNAYAGVDTRDTTQNLLTPQNLAQKQTDLVNTLNRNNPYRVAYTPINRGIKDMPASVQDPYSNEGLQFLYGNMMNQYAPPPADFVNPGTYVSEPYRYTPPPQTNLVLNTPIPDATKPATPAADPAVTARLAPATD